MLLNERMCVNCCRGISLSVISDCNSCTGHNSPGVAFLVVLAETTPFSQCLAGVNLEQTDAMFLAQCFNQLRDVSIIKVCCE